MIRSDRGFTLIEALIALFILTVGILAVAKLQGTAVKGDAKAGDITRNSLLVSDKIEELLSLDFADANLNSGGIHFDDPNCLQKDCIAWRVIDDMPVPAIEGFDTDGETALPEGERITVSKMVQVYAYDGNQGFNSETADTQLLHISFIKTRSINFN